MEQPNVNNLNGIPNFGHGFPEEAVVPTEVEEDTVDEVTEETNTESNAKAKRSKKTTQE